MTYVKAPVTPVAWDVRCGRAPEASERPDWDSFDRYMT